MFGVYVRHLKIGIIYLTTSAIELLQKLADGMFGKTNLHTLQLQFIHILADDWRTCPTFRDFLATFDKIEFRTRRLQIEYHHFGPADKWVVKLMEKLTAKADKGTMSESWEMNKRSEAKVALATTKTMTTLGGKKKGAMS